jgi:broad specificity phosphatase PhoE
MTLFIIRHPETECNRKGITQGHSDSSFTRKGREIAQILGGGC